MTGPVIRSLSPAAFSVAALLMVSCSPAPVAGVCLVPPVADPSRPEAGMVWIPAGIVELGSEQFFAEERPLRTAQVEGFWMSTHEVTEAEFAAFVAATGYVTLAEREGENAGGGGVFGPGVQVRDWSDIRTWWRFEPRASWRRPQGRETGGISQSTLPVVQIAYEDALAYARWRGHDLPGEAQWEWAARGGLSGAPYVWGDEVRPGGEYHANHWQGIFPVEDSGADGHAGRAPVGCYAPNGYGLYDMAGNVWEWTTDRWEQPGFRVIKGGSFLCSDSYCHRYRPAARQPGDERFSTEHLGFRTVWHGPPPQDGT